MSAVLTPRSIGPQIAGSSVLSDDPRPEIRAGALVILVSVALIGGWTGLAPLDAAATATGQIEITGHNQVVQYHDGGTVASVDVIEGQHVRAGQPLVELMSDDASAQVRALRAQYISLEAARARLSTELADGPAIQWPSDFDTLSGADLAVAKGAMASQQAQFVADKGAFRAQIAANSERAAGLRGEMDGDAGQIEATQRRQALLQQQLESMRGLAAKGFASQNSVRNLEASVADLTGAERQHDANLTGFRHQIAEASMQSRGLEYQRRQQAASALRDADDQLNALIPKLAAAHQDLERGTLRAQTDGVVTGLSIFRAGAVIGPDQVLMQVVPTNPVLTVEARLLATDIAGVHVGQRAEVRVQSMSGRGAPILSGAVSEISADSFADQRSGVSYYTAQITVPKHELDRARGADAGIQPGVPVQVMIPLRKRTAFEYLFEPLSQALWSSFRQR